jgi:hypothetical protein
MIRRVQTLPPSDRLGHFILYLSVWIVVLVVSLSVQDTFKELINQLLGDAAGWDRIGAHFGFTTGIFILFVAMSRHLSKMDDALRLDREQAAATGDNIGPMGNVITKRSVPMRSRQAIQYPNKNNSVGGHIMPPVVEFTHL